MLTLALILLIIAFASGAPLWSIMILGAALGSIATGRGLHDDFGGSISEFIRMGTGDAADVFSTIPLFIFAGYIMAASKTADRLVNVSNAFLGAVPGGLGIVTIFACAIFTTFTGASGVTIVALGGLLMPALIKQRYPERFALGLVTGTGSIGLLLPPALPLFIFGTVLGLQQELTKKWAAQNYEWEWDTQRFIFAGIGPSAVLFGCMAVMVVITAVVKKVPRMKYDMPNVPKYLLRTFLIALPELLLPVLIIAALAKGVGGIAEIASLTVVYLIFVEMVIFRDIKPSTLWHITKEALALVGAIFIIVFASSAITNYLATAGVPEKMVAWTSEHIDSRMGFLLALNVLLIIVGMMMDIFSAILIVLPLVAPIAFRYGVNPYHLGVIFLLNLEIGYLTPPVGLNLFISSFKFRTPVLDVVRAVLPFMGAMFVALAIVTFFPGLTTEPPPKPRGTLDGLVAIVQASKQAVVNVKEVTLPNGKVVKQDECGAITDDFDRENCLGVFTDVTKCRQKADPAEAKECEDTAMKEYFGETDDGGSFEDDGDDEGGGGFEADGDDDEAADGDATDEDADGDAGTAPAADGDAGAAAPAADGDAGAAVPAAADAGAATP
jgi:C4-dicarboxylate transporter DctM subunit